MKIEIVNGQKGYLLKTDEYKKLEPIILNGKICYFMPYRYTRGQPLDKEQVEQAIKDNADKKTICDALECNAQKLDNFLWKHWGSKKLNVIKALLSEPDSSE